MANLNDLKGSIVLFVMIGILLGIGITVFTQFGNSMQTTSPVVNETITGLVNQDVALANTRVASVTTIMLANGTVVPSSAYTLRVDPAAITLKTVGLWNNNTVANVTYNRYVDSTATTTMTSLTNALTPIGSTWMPLVITVLILAIVLGIVISSFGNKR